MFSIHWFIIKMVYRRTITYSCGRCYLFSVPWSQYPLHVAAYTLHGSSSNNALRRTTNSHEDVNPAPFFGSRNGSGHVPVRDELDPCSSSPNLIYQFLVPLPVQDHRSPYFRICL